MPALALQQTVDLLALQAAFPTRYPVLLETGGSTGWDILLALPQQVEQFDAGAAHQVFEQLASHWHEEQCAPAPDLNHLPFRGGWFVYLSYELLHALEPSVAVHTVTHGFPYATVMRIPAALMVDKISHTTWLFAENDAYLAVMQHSVANLPCADWPSWQLESLVEEDEQIFTAGVAAIQHYIRAGDVFQVNLSRRWRGLISAGTTPCMLFRALRRANPAPFSGVARLNTRQSVISSSPERLVSVRAGRVSTRPIAGTFARHANPEHDAQIKLDLLAHPKERAEHVMLVDLERNDLGKVCQPGSVQVESLMGVSSYAFVHHIESIISGTLQADKTPIDVLRALFPGGTITGCPKVRTMQLIQQLENSPRGAYTGSMGYINRDGDMDMNILIRSIMLDGQRIQFSAGAGIVADSDPQRELQETRAKALGMMRALESTT